MCIMLKTCNADMQCIARSCIICDPSFNVPFFKMDKTINNSSCWINTQSESEYYRTESKLFLILFNYN